jgi:23S rRNA A2030 N6-methylase RlmJ
MLAYRHAFHAGNHADVLKHIVLVLVLRHLAAKEKGFRFVDTHGGAGGYSLQGRYARKHDEHARGIGALWTRDDLPAAVADYVELVRTFNPDGKLAQYPGSPSLALMLLRPQDELRAFELHPTEEKILRATLAGQRRASAVFGDGFTGLRSQLPPPTRRGAVLVDPSYEGTADYPKVVATMRDAVARFADGSLRRLVPAGEQARGGTAAAPPRGARAEGLAARATHRAGARCARLRPRRQRRLRPPSAAHAARGARRGPAVPRRRARAIEGRRLPARRRRAVARCQRGADAERARICASQSVQSTGPDSKLFFRLPRTLPHARSKYA